MSDRYTAIRERLSGDDPLIVDAGAYKGEIADRFLALFPRARVLCFEPIPKRAEKLAAKYESDPRVEVHNLALGSTPGTADFHVTVGNPYSSLLDPADPLRRYHGERTQVAETIQVEVARLDGLLDRPANIVKMDVQGFEIEILRGLGDMLQNVDAIASEVSFLPRYHGQPLFADLDRFLRKQGFGLLNFFEPMVQPDGRLTAAETVYFREGLL